MEQTLEINQMANLKNETIKDIVQRERKNLFRYIRRRVSNDPDAEDILQEVFYQFINTIQFQTIDNIVSWLFTAAGNKITDRFRKKKALLLDDIKQKASYTDENDGLLNLADILFDPAEDPDDLYLRSTVWPLLSDALEELPPEQRDVFIMHELEDRSFRDISAATGIPVNTLISRKHYAILFLRDKLRYLYELFFNV